MSEYLFNQDCCNDYFFNLLVCMCAFLLPLEAHDIFAMLTLLCVMVCIMSSSEFCSGHPVHYGIFFLS